MAHKYNNFADAFDDNRSKFSSIKTNRTNAYNAAAALWTHATSSEWQDAFWDTKLAIQALAAAVYLLIDGAASNYQQSYYYESFYWAGQEPSGIAEYELTWQKICEAWVANDFEGKEWTIAVIDRMRTLMWDKPFDIKWAASPTAAKG